MNFGLTLLSFLLPLTFIPGLFNAPLAPRWALLSVAVPLLLWLIKLEKSNTMVIVGVMAVLATLSLLWTPVLVEGENGLWQFALLLGVFIVGFSVKSLDKPLKATVLAAALIVPLVVAQRFGYDGIQQVASPAGLFGNKNVAAELFAVALVIAAWRRMGWAVATLAVGVALTGEKAAMLGVFVAGLMFAVPRIGRFWNGLVFTLLGCLALMFSDTIFNANNGRFDIWADMLPALTFFGHGIGSFFSSFPQYAQHVNTALVRPDYAHNDFLQLVYELGIVGVVAGFLLAKTMFKCREAYALPLACLATEALFAFPLHMPCTGFLVALLAGAGARDWAALRAVQWDSRIQARERSDTLIHGSATDDWGVGRCCSVVPVGPQLATHSSRDERAVGTVSAYPICEAAHRICADTRSLRNGPGVATGAAFQ